MATPVCYLCLGAYTLYLIIGLIFCLSWDRDDGNLTDGEIVLKRVIIVLLFPLFWIIDWVNKHAN